MLGQTRQILSVLALGMLGCGDSIVEASSDELGGSGETELGESEAGESSSSTAADTSTTDASTTETSTTDTSTESTTDTSTTDTSTDTTDTSTTEESTDTSVDTACNESISFTIQAVDAEYGGGWEEYMSDLGEGLVLSMADGENMGVVTFDLDIPCDDTWHIWVRAIDYQTFDSFWTRVDGQPVGWTLFDIDCTNGPMDAVYKWNELNRHDEGAQDCQYTLDPWTQNWALGPHTLELGFRDAYAISKVWVSNTAGNPP